MSPHIVGGPPETSTTVEVRFPLVQLPSSSRGSDMAIVDLVDGGNLSKGLPIGMAHPQNLLVGWVLSGTARQLWFTPKS